MLRNDAQNTDKENNNKSNNSQINTLTSDPIILICLSIFPGTTAPSAKRTCDTKIIKRHGKIQAVRSDGLFFFTAKYKANCAAYLAHVSHRGNALKKIGESKMNTEIHAQQTHEKIIIQNIWTRILDRIFGEVYCVCKCLCVRETCVRVRHTRTFSILLFSSAA